LRKVANRQTNKQQRLHILLGGGNGVNRPYRWSANKNTDIFPLITEKSTK